jgi:hypothetical protein
MGRAVVALDAPGRRSDVVAAIEEEGYTVAAADA